MDSKGPCGTYVILCELHSSNMTYCFSLFLNWCVCLSEDLKYLSWVIFVLYQAKRDSIVYVMHQSFVSIPTSSPPPPPPPPHLLGIVGTITFFVHYSPAKSLEHCRDLVIVVALHFIILTLVSWTLICPAFANSVDPDQLASEEANWSGSALFVINYVNLYQQPGSSDLICWKLKLGMAS